MLLIVNREVPPTFEPATGKNQGKICRLVSTGIAEIVPVKDSRAVEQRRTEVPRSLELR